MRILRHLVSGGLGVAVLALGSPASALVFTTTTTSTYNWTLTGNDTNIPSTGKSFASTVKIDNVNTTITMTARAFNATKLTGATNYTFTAATLQQYSGGLAAVSGSANDAPANCGGTGGCNQHQIDNLGSKANTTSIDFIRLDFDKAVVLGGFGQTVYPMLYADERKYSNGSYKYQYDDDYSVGVLTGAPGSSNKTDVVAGLTGVSSLTSIFGIQDPNTNSCTPTGSNTTCLDQATVYTKYQSGAVTASKTWYVAASVLANYNNDNPDGFKLASLTAYYKTTTSHQSMAPEPSSWMTMIVGFGVAGTSMRRARRQKAATIAA